MLTEKIISLFISIFMVTYIYIATKFEGNIPLGIGHILIETAAITTFVTLQFLI